jgi:hypothetical protein
MRRISTISDSIRYMSDSLLRDLASATAGIRRKRSKLGFLIG